MKRDTVDLQCIRLCIALSRLRGLKTTSCCCGHKFAPLSIVFDAYKHTPNFKELVEYINEIGWELDECSPDEGVRRYLLLSKKIGTEAYEEAIRIAQFIENNLLVFE